MFDALETGFGLDVILWLQNLRVPALELLARVLDFMGEEMLYIGVIALIYWLFNKRLGMRLIFILLLANLVTSFAKDIFATERPYEVSTLVNELVQEGTYGIPSGHVLVSLAVWGYLAYSLKQPWVWALTIVYVLLQSFGRMIAGAHYPQDVVAGWLLGGGLLLLYIAFAEKVANFWQSSKAPIRIGIVALSVLLILGGVYFLGTRTGLSLTLAETPCPVGTELVGASCIKLPHLENYFTSLGLLLGAVGALALNLDFKANPQLWRRGLLYVAGLVLAIVLLIVLGAVANAISETGTLAYVLRTMRYGLVTFAALGLWPLVSLRFGLLDKIS